MKKLLTLLAIGLMFNCSNESVLTEPIQTDTEQFENLKEGILPPKFDRTPINTENLKKKDQEIDMLLLPPPPQIVWEELYYAGEGKINIVFVADGFQNFDMYLFDATVADILDEFQSSTGGFTFQHDNHNGYGSHDIWEDFNFYVYRLESNESGISIRTHIGNPVTEVIVDTQWNSYFNEIGIERLMAIPEDDYERLEDDLLKQPNGYLVGEKAVFPIIITNTNEYGGSGSFMDVNPGNNKMALSLIPVNNSWFYKLFIHEAIGHSFSDQDDEYIDQDYLDLAEVYAPEYFNYPERANITTDNINDRKWDVDLNATPPVDYFLGGRYASQGHWRSIESGFMKAINWAIGDVNKDIIRDAVDKYLDD